MLVLRSVDGVMVGTTCQVTCRASPKQQAPGSSAACAVCQATGARHSQNPRTSFTLQPRRPIDPPPPPTPCSCSAPPWPSPAAPPCPCRPRCSVAASPPPPCAVSVALEKNPPGEMSQACSIDSRAELPTAPNCAASSTNTDGSAPTGNAVPDQPKIKSFQGTPLSLSSALVASWTEGASDVSLGA
jgi:hypothetical protein